MSLDEMPAASLRQLAGRLETLGAEWAIAPTKERRNEINEAFKALTAEIKQRFGADGQKVVEEFLARHRDRHS